jgi:hypothetical protein
MSNRDFATAFSLEFRSRRRSFGAGFFVFRKKLMFDVRAGIAEPLVALQVKRPPVEQKPRSSRGGRGFDFLARVRGYV